MLILILAARNIQIFNLQLKAKLKAHMMNQDIVYWKWINVNMLGIVTETAVYHWSMEGNGDIFKER